MARYQLITLYTKDGSACGILSEHHSFNAAAIAARKLKAWATRLGMGCGDTVIRDTAFRMNELFTPGGTRIPRDQAPAGIDAVRKLR